MALSKLNHRDSTGALILAPSIGNLHGAYLKPPNFRQDMSADVPIHFLDILTECPSLRGTVSKP